jgi:glutaredoxin
MSDHRPILYIKDGCPYCEEAMEFLDDHGVTYELKEVLNDPRAFEEMRRKSGQSKAPTLEFEGKILSDFGVDELPQFLRERNVKLEDS